MSDTNAQILIDNLDTRLCGGDGTAFVVEMLNYRMFEFTVQAMDTVEWSFLSRTSPSKG